MRELVRAVVIHDDRLLVMFRQRDGRSFVTLPGGGIDPGESAEQAAVREVLEETSIAIEGTQLVAQIDSARFGSTQVFVASYVSGEPRLAADAIEAELNQAAPGAYTPGWLPLAGIASAELLPVELKKLITDWLEDGQYPAQPVHVQAAD